MSQAEVHLMLKQEREKDSILIFVVDLEPPFPLKPIAKPYPVGYIVLQYQKRGQEVEHLRTYRSLLRLPSGFYYFLSFSMTPLLCFDDYKSM